MNSRKIHKAVWSMVAAAAIMGGSYVGVTQLAHTNSVLAETAKPTPTPPVEVIAPATDLSRAFRTVHDAMKDAVVNINVAKRSNMGNGNVRMMIPDELRGMLPPGFEDQFRGQMQNPVVQGTGSGVIVSADGYILTNNHVVDGADDITVTLNDGRELKAERIGTDPKTDLAVVRIKADKLSYAKFGNSDDLQVGDWVLAFGSPFGFSQTMTQGIISAKGRHVPIISEHNPNLRGMTYENFLQTDAAINPGNSGGPLVNLKGEVVGINAAIASSTGSYNGIGFTIPSNDAQYIMRSLIDNGKVVRGYLGIGIENINRPAPEHKGLVEDLRKSGFKADKGVLVGSVQANGPAAKSGLQAGDVITSVNGKPFADVDELRNQIARTTPDSKLKLGIFRDGKAEEITTTVGTQPDGLRTVAQTDSRGTREKAQPEGAILGVRVGDVDDATAKRSGLTDKKGAVIASVQPDGLAADAGLQPGDVVTKFGKKTINNSQEFVDAVKSADLKEGVKMVVRGDDGSDRVVYLEKK